MSTISIVTTLKSSLPTICHFLDYHFSIGVRRFYLFFDDSDVVAVNYVRQRYADSVIAYDCNEAYWKELHGIERPASVESRQRLNAHYALSFANQNGDGWIAHIDIDEYIYVSGSNLLSVLESVSEKTNVVRMDVLEAIPTSLWLENVFDIRFFKSMPFDVSLNDSSYRLLCRLRRSILLFAYRVLFRLGRVIGMSCVKDGLDDFYNAHSTGKCITRISDDVVSLRVHFPWFVEGVKVRVHSTSQCVMLHFESCCFSDWMAKWLRRSSAEGFAAALDRRQKVIFDLFSACSMDKEKLESLYKKLYFYPESQLRT